MRRVQRAILILIILFVVLGVLMFVLENQECTTLSFMGWTTACIPLSIFVTLSLIFGMIVGPIVRFLWRMRASI